MTVDDFWTTYLARIRADKDASAHMADNILDVLTRIDVEELKRTVANKGEEDD